MNEFPVHNQAYFDYVLITDHLTSLVGAFNVRVLYLIAKNPMYVH